MTTSGPRPLRLASSAESPTITSPTPLTPRSAGLDSSKRNSSFRSNPRRQSSISYNPRPRDDPLSPALFSPRHAAPVLTPDSPGPSSRPNLSRSASVGSRVPRRTESRGERSAYSGGADPSTPATVNWNRNRNSTGSLLAEERERPALTLVEKHAELLHFIAQKESKCLELRTQLSAHEAELLQLKRKWERIVFRGFEKSQVNGERRLPSSMSPSPDSIPITNATHPPSASIYSAASLSYLDSLSTQAQGAGSAAMLEALGGMKGIRESVQQGVGRFLGAVAGTNDPSYTTAHRRSLTHTPSQSSSSASTYATSSTRFSQSSQSSFGDIVPTSISEEDGDLMSDSNIDVTSMKRARKHRPTHIGIVSDTGATPLVSPTRDFALESPPRTATPSTRTVHGGGNMRSRRKSRTFSSESPTEITGTSASEETNRCADSDTNTSESLSSSLVDWGMGLSSPPPVDSPVPGQGSGKRNLNKRMSLPARALSSGSGADSWMGSVVGKRWEDTISKNQKRASVLLSDVSQSISQSIPQSIIQALVSPPLSASSELALPPGYHNGTRRQASPASASSASLLDEDIPFEESGGSLTPLLEPSPAPFPVLSPTKLAPSSSEPQPKSPMKNKFSSSPAGVRNAGKTNTTGSKFISAVASQEDDDDDWNW